MADENRNPNIGLQSLSGLLANEQTNKMNTAPTGRDSNWTKSYMEMLINPFSTTISEPKIFDGEIKYTAGLKLRVTGEIECSTANNTNIIIFPGLTNVMCWCTTPDNSDKTASPTTGNINIDGTLFKSHLSTPEDRKNVRVARLVGAGARFYLANPSDTNDGWFEACRLTSHHFAGDSIFKSDTGGNLGQAVLKVLSNDYDLGKNNKTYHSGELKDLKHWIFKLNSEDNDHKFSVVTGLNQTLDPALNNATALADFDQWDMIFIRIRGRRVPGSPSILRFDSMSNQEVVYSEESMLARLMTDSPRHPNIEGFLEYSRVDKPSFMATPVDGFGPVY